MYAHHQYIHSNCMEACQYTCSWEITQTRIYTEPVALPQHKYHGHWVFLRPFGLHEACSSLFSLLNALPHVLQVLKQWQWVGDRSKGGCGWDSTYCLDAWVRAYPYVAIVTWLASAAYHARRTNDSHLLDLCTALVLLAYGLLLTVRRMLGPLPSWTHPSRPRALVCAWWLFLAVGGVLLLWRLHAMCIAGTIGYQAHMNVAVPLAGISCGLWIFWALTAYDARSMSLPQRPGRGIAFNWIPHGSSRTNRYFMIVFQICFICAAMMEIFDFPPWASLLDAHATWHACTVPLGFMWYKFLKADAQHMSDCDASATVAEIAVSSAAAPAKKRRSTKESIHVAVAGDGSVPEKATAGDGHGGRQRSRRKQPA